MPIWNDRHESTARRLDPERLSSLRRGKESAEPTDSVQVGGNPVREETMNGTTLRQAANDEDGCRTGEVEIVSRLAIVIRNTKLDCECKSKLDDALARFAALEQRRMARRHLSSARSQRERIEAFLGFLRELDDMGATEPDHSVLEEIAILFDDIANAAREGAYSMRKLSPLKRT
jgi:hypothetical protein